MWCVLQNASLWHQIHDFRNNIAQKKLDFKKQAALKDHWLRIGHAHPTKLALGGAGSSGALAGAAGASLGLGNTRALRPSAQLSRTSWPLREEGFAFSNPAEHRILRGQPGKDGGPGSPGAAQEASAARLGAQQGCPGLLPRAPGGGRVSGRPGLPLALKALQKAPFRRVLEISTLTVPRLMLPSLLCQLSQERTAFPGELS